MNISELKVLMSNAGYYIGRTQNGMPYSRESRYYASKTEAQIALQLGFHENIDGGIE